MKKKEQTPKSNWLWLFIPGFALLMLGILLLLTQPTYNKYWDFSNKGQIGDTIGGITGPFINLLGAILVYLSFQQQREANRIQSEALQEDRDRTNSLNKFNQLVNLMTDVNELYESFELKYQIGASVIIYNAKGNEGLKIFNKYMAELKQHTSPTSKIQNIIQVQSSYMNFINIASFIANGIISYTNEEDDHSENVLKIKFYNLVSKFESNIINIQSSSWNSGLQYSNAICKMSESFLNQMKTIRGIDL